MRKVVGAVLGGVLLAGCGNATSQTTPPTSRSQTSSPSTSPCASVKQTTAIQGVPSACAAAWTPFGVTQVPPDDELQLEHVPHAPSVTNKTGGAVSTSDAQRWADANNASSGWFKWAEANHQPALLGKLAGAAVINQSEVDALDHGAVIALPDCSLYPLALSLFKISPDGQAYFARKHLPADADFVFVVRYQSPCIATATYPDGHTAAIDESASQGGVFVPGRLEALGPLGEVWYSDAGGNCDDVAGPPAEWCGR